MSDLATVRKLARHLARDGAMPPRASGNPPTIQDPDNLPLLLEPEIEKLLDRNPHLGWATAAIVCEFTAQHPETRAHALALLLVIRALNACTEFHQALQLCLTNAPLFAKLGANDLLAHLWIEAAWAQGYLDEPQTVADYLVRARAANGKLPATLEARAKWIAAFLLFGESKYPEARKLLRRVQNAALKRGDRLGAMRALRLIGNITERTKPNAAIEILRTARAFFVRTHRPLDTAYCDYYLAQCLTALGKYAQAHVKLRHALREFRKHKVPYYAALVQLDVSVADWYLGRYQHMLRACERARDEFERLQARQEYTTALLNMGSALTALNRFDDAIPFLEQALREAETNGRRAKAASALAGLAEAYEAQGQYALALQALQRVRATYENISRYEYLVLCELEIARAYVQLNQPQKILEAIERAAQVAAREKMRVPLAKVELYRAHMFLAQGDMPSAQAALLRARVGFARKKQKTDIAFCDRLLAEIPGPRPAANFRRLAKARATFRKQQQAMDVAICDLIRAEIELRQNEHAQAERAFVRALAVLEYFPAYHARIQYGLARCKTDRAPQAALAHYVQAAQIVAQLRGETGLEELSNSFFQARERVIAEGLALAHRLNAPRQALQLIQAAKAQLFVRTLAPQTAKQAASSPRVEALRKQEQLLRVQLNKLRQELAGRRGNAQEVKKHIARLAALAKKHKRVVGELRLEHGGLSGLPVLGTFDLEKFRAAAAKTWGKDWVALDYYLTSDWLYRVTIDGHTVKLQVEPWSPLDQKMLVDATANDVPRRELVYNRTINGFRMPPTMDPLRHLAPKLIPAELWTRSDVVLLVSPHGLLHQIALQALPLGEQERLLERFTLSYIPNLQAFTQLADAQTPPKPSTLLLCGAETFQAPVTPLEHTHAEVRALEALYPNAAVLWQAPTPRDALMERNARHELAQYDLLHFATHATVVLDAPHTSSILLGAQEVTVLDIMEWELNAALVTLSACSTLLGQGGSGDEWVSLARAFFYAGARALVASLWEVQDASTTKLMQLFYAKLERGDSIAVALRNAQLEMMAEGATPYQWAAFTASGVV